jgi:hypothetical protein
MPLLTCNYLNFIAYMNEDIKQQQMIKDLEAQGLSEVQDTKHAKLCNQFKAGIPKNAGREADEACREAV